MKFNRKLSYDEIRALSKEEDRLYHKWLEEEQEKKREEKTKNWTFDNWAAEAFTFNNYSAARRDFFLKEEKIEELVYQRIGNNKEEQFIYFWETESPFSQWHSSVFTGPTYMWDNNFLNQLMKKGYPKERKFSSAEQWMMYCKAMLFLDLEIADKIMVTDNSRKIKQLGREVKRFNENTWKVFRWRFIYEGNKYKFTQNEKLKEYLFATKGTTLVEASPYDKIWGIGLRATDSKARKRSTWQGKNLLGEILTELRIELMGEY